MTTTLNKLASEQSLRKYNVLRNFSIGQIDIPVEEGDVLEYTRGKLLLYGQEYKVTNLEFAIKAGWIELAKGETPDPVIDRILGTTAPKVEVSKPQETEEASSENSLVETVNGVETLPDDWDNLHWTKKRAYIINMRDVDLLSDIMEGESDKLKSIIQKHLDTLVDNSAPVTRVSMKKTSTGTPEKAKKIKPAIHEDYTLETSFGPTVKKAINIASEKFDSTVTVDPDSEVVPIKN